MNIGIDIDNVIADTFKDLADFFNQFMGQEHAPHEVVHIMRKRKYLMLAYFFQAWRQRVMTKVPLIEGAAETIRSWHKEHRIHLVTSRIRLFNRQTRQWLKKHQIPYHELHHAQETTKHEKVKNCAFFIEDNIDEAHVLADHCERVFLFDQPWNRLPIRRDNIIRVKGWQEINIIYNPPAPDPWLNQQYLPQTQQTSA